MTSLTSERCEACHRDSPSVPESDEPVLLKQIPDWRLIEVDGVKRLQRVFNIKGW